MDDGRATMGTLNLSFYYDNDINHRVDNYSLKVDATLSALKFGTRYASTHSRRAIDYAFHQDAPTASDRYNHTERIWAGYVEYAPQLNSKWSLSIGGRYEQTWTCGEPLVGPVVSKHYGRLFPSFFVGYTPSPSHSLNWSLTTRITRPNVININPYVVWRDAYHATCGNQDLQPTYFYKLMTGYTY